MPVIDNEIESAVPYNKEMPYKKLTEKHPRLAVTPAHRRCLGCMGCRIRFPFCLHVFAHVFLFGHPAKSCGVHFLLLTDLEVKGVTHNLV